MTMHTISDAVIFVELCPVWPTGWTVVVGMVGVACEGGVVVGLPVVVIVAVVALQT